MTFKTIYQIALICLCVFQVVLAIIAEGREEYTEAIYEMLWLFFFLKLADEEFKNV